jgi:hypothetical protein
MLAVRHFYLFVQSRDFTLVAAPDNARENKYFTNNVMNAVHCTLIYYEVLMRFYVIFKQPWYVLRPTCFASCSYDQLVAICAASHYVYVVSSVETTTLIKNEFSGLCNSVSLCSLQSHVSRYLFALFRIVGVSSDDGDGCTFDYF